MKEIDIQEGRTDS